MIQTEAIQYSWELLTDVFQLSKDRLYVTYFEGDPKNGLEPDLEAKQYWIERGVAEDHILPGNAKDNFWGKELFCCTETRGVLLSNERDGRHRSLRSLQVRKPIWLLICLMCPMMK